MGTSSLGRVGVAMDSRRFDTLARALAMARTRREALKAVLAGMVVAVVGGSFPGRAGAQQNVPIGGRCSAFGANSECSQADTPSGGVAVICSDNGIARDGAFNCCRNAGGNCSQDFYCCGGALCINGVCGGSSSSGLRLGAECTSTSQCSQTGGSVVCGDNGIPEDGGRNCCRNTSGSCSGDIDCCATLYCVNGTCGGSNTTPTGNGLRQGSECTSTSQCDQSAGNIVCADNGFVGDGALNCCANEGGPCTGADYSADCCGGLYCREGSCRQITRDGRFVLGAPCDTDDQCSQEGGAVACADNGIASDGPLNCCRYRGGVCSGDSNCCEGLPCSNGVCGGSVAASGGSLALGAECSAESQCSQQGGAVTCADNGIASDGALNCCRYQGGACFGGSSCCAGLECVDGVCGGGAATAETDADGGATSPAGSGFRAQGAACNSDDECDQTGGEVACRDNGLPGDGDRNCCRYGGGACAGDTGCCAGYLCVNGTCQS